MLGAAYYGDIAKVKELLGQGLPVDVKDEVNSTCTHSHKCSLERCIHLGVVCAYGTPGSVFNKEKFRVSIARRLHCNYGGLFY